MVWPLPISSITCRSHEPALPFIRDTLAQYPNLRATRIYEMVRQRGYPGSVIQVRRPVDCDERDV